MEGVTGGTFITVLISSKRHGLHCALSGLMQLTNFSLPLLNLKSYFTNVRLTLFIEQETVIQSSGGFFSNPQRSSLHTSTNLRC